MARPPIIAWTGERFRRQLLAALDWLEGNAGGPSDGPGALIGLKVHTGPDEPVGAQENDLWIETEALAGTGQIISIQATAPASPSVGDLWIPTT